MAAEVEVGPRGHAARAGVLRLWPPLDTDERELLLGLAGRGPVLRVWPGQPRSRSPWVPCGDGCCLELRPGHRVDPAAWMRFLLRGVLDPRSRPALARAAVLGLPGGHRVTGRAGVRDVEVVVRGDRVQLLPAPGDGTGERAGGGWAGTGTDGEDDRHSTER